MSFYRPSGSLLGTTDNNYKEKGNRFFMCKQYESAILCYSKAINENSQVPIYYTNRALCYLITHQWQKARIDCLRALNIDSNCIKALAFMGITLIELQSYRDAIEQLQKANKLAKDNQVSYIDDITKQLKRACNLKLEQQQTLRQIQALKVLSNATKLMDDDLAKKISNMRISSHNTEKFEDSVTIIKNQHKSEVPDYLHDVISLDIMLNPVITPSGITYDCKSIEKHLKPITVNQLLPNLTLKEVVKEFVIDNEFVNFQ